MRMRSFLNHFNMDSGSVVVAEALLEDHLADIWPDFPCLYDVRCPEFKNRDLRENAFEEIAEKLGKTGNVQAKRGSVCVYNLLCQMLYVTTYHSSCIHYFCSI